MQIGLYNWKKDKYVTLRFGCTCLLWDVVSWTLPLVKLLLHLWSMAMKATFITCYNVGMEFGIFFGLRMEIETHSLEMLCTVGRSTAEYFVNAFLLMLWEIQVQ
jgi:hypothetical protein